MVLAYVIKAGSLTQMLLCLAFCNFTAWDLRESTVSQGGSNIKNQDFSVRSNDSEITSKSNKSNVSLLACFMIIKFHEPEEFLKTFISA